MISPIVSFVFAAFGNTTIPSSLNTPMQSIQFENNTLINEVQNNSSPSDLKQKLSKYEFYTTAINTINRSGESITDQEKLNSQVLDKVGNDSCNILTQSNGNITQSTLSKMVETPSIQPLINNPEHFGVAVAVSVYYECDSYTDEVLEFLRNAQAIN
jgi:hypothetical protein